MIQSYPVYKKEHIPEDWEERLVALWSEDDVPIIDKERTDTAFKRITKEDPKNYLHVIDRQDHAYYFYRRGWVRLISCEGGAVFLLIRDKKK